MMCGRYRLDEHSIGYEKLFRLIEEKDMLASKEAFQSGDVFPGGNCLVLCAKEQIYADVKHWGTKNFDNKLLINARSENLNHTKIFEGFRPNKCIIVANGYYEWDKHKEQHYFEYNPEGLIYMAGIYKGNDFVILTEESTRHHDIHHRQPILYTPQDVINYLKAQVKPWN